MIKLELKEQLKKLEVTSSLVHPSQEMALFTEQQRRKSKHQDLVISLQHELKRELGKTSPIEKQGCSTAFESCLATVYFEVQTKRKLYLELLHHVM